jgi:energy-converting hydrogenase Eha subunit E
MANDSTASQRLPDTGPEGAPSSHRSVMNIAVDVVRHLVPLLPLYLLNGSIASYLLLTAFDLSLGLMLIVGTTRDRKDPTSVDPRSRWLVMRLLAVVVIAIFLAFVAAIITLPIAAPAFIFGLANGVDWPSTVTNKHFWIPVAGMSLLAAIRAQGLFEATTTPGQRGQPTRAAPVIGDLEGNRRRSLADNAAQVTLIATFAALCYVLLSFGRWGSYALPVVYAALLVFYDTRPDIARGIFPKLWQQK